MKTSLLAALALLLGAECVAAQDPQKEEERVQQLVRRQDPKRTVEEAAQEARVRELEAAAEGGDGDAADKLGKPGPDGKVESLEPAIRGDLTSHMAPIVSLQPRRIAPGGSGEVVIVLAMQRGTVLEAGKLTVDYPRDQGSLVFGEWVLDDPAPGVEQGPFRGVPVHESYAKVTVPVTVKPDAKFGTTPVRFQLTAQITDGASGNSRGDARGVAQALLEIGPPLPTPPAPRAGAAVRPAVSVPNAGSSTPTGNGGDRVEPEADPTLRAQRAGVAGGPTADPADGAPGPLPFSDGGGPDPLLVGGGGLVVLLLAVVLFGLRRR